MRMMGCLMCILNEQGLKKKTPCRNTGTARVFFEQLAHGISKKKTVFCLFLHSVNMLYWRSRA
ncbi:MAG: hypothetical protein ACR2K1_01810, partial [Saprospiraceae bacterium]